MKSRSIKSSTNWYEFVRCQGIQMIDADKLIINPLFKTDGDIEVKNYIIPAGVILYSRIFATGVNLDQLSEFHN